MQRIFLVFICLFLSCAHAKTPAQKKKSVEKKASHVSTIKPEIPVSTIPVDVDVEAEQAFLMDFETGNVLLQKNGQMPIHPSSMTKIMTAYLIFEKLKSGMIQPDQLITVPKEGWRVEGSSMFLNLGDQVSVMDLLRGLIIQSGNDAGVTLAQAISGSELIFALEMTQRAKELGALHTNFVNVSGLPHETHLTTAQDMAFIGRRIIQDFPQYYPIFAEKEFTYRNIKQGNRNPLLYVNMGAVCDGIKTGHTNIAGYGMVASCAQDQRRFILVINGTPSMQVRANEARKLITWGLNTFANYKLFHAQQLVQEVPVWYGQENKMPLTVDRDVIATLARISRKDLKVKIIYPSALQAPLQKGTTVGKIIISAPTLPTPIEFPLITAITIERSGFFGSIKDSLAYFIKGQK